MGRSSVLSPVPRGERKEVAWPRSRVRPLFARRQSHAIRICRWRGTLLAASSAMARFAWRWMFMGRRCSEPAAPRTTVDDVPLPLSLAGTVMTGLYGYCSGRRGCSPAYSRTVAMVSRRGVAGPDARAMLASSLLGRTAVAVIVRTIPAYWVSPPRVRHLCTQFLRSILKLALSSGLRGAAPFPVTLRCRRMLRSMLGQVT